jgi:hypothetical protein
MLIGEVAPLLSKRLLPPPDASPTSKFINVFSEIPVPGPEISFQYPAIGRAIKSLNSLANIPPHSYSDGPLSEQEIDRLMCIVYISFACTRSQHSCFNLELLNDFLETTEHVWYNSVATLRWLLTQSVGKGPAGLKDAQRTGRLAEIARLLTQSSYNSLEKNYLGILVQEPAEAGGLLSPAADD